MSSAYFERFDGTKILTEGELLGTVRMEYVLQAVLPLGVVPVESLKDKPDVLLSQKLSKKLKSELTKYVEPPEVISTKQALHEWLLPSSEDLSKLMSQSKGALLESLCEFFKYVATHAPLHRWDLKKVNLANVVVESDIRLSKHSISDSNFKNARFDRLVVQSMTNCRLDENASRLISARQASNLSFRRATCWVNLTEAQDCNFDKAELAGLNLGSAKACSLKGTTSTSGLSRSKLQDCMLARSSFKGRVEDVTLDDCDASRVTFDEAEVHKLQATNCTLAGASFADCRMHNVTFKTCDLSRASFRNVLMHKADFRGCDLTNADFRGAIMIDVKLDGATLTGAKFAGARLSGVRTSKLDPTMLAKAEVFKTVKFGSAIIDVVQKLSKLKLWELRFYVINSEDQCLGIELRQQKKGGAISLSRFRPVQESALRTPWDAYDRKREQVMLRFDKIEQSLRAVQVLLQGLGAIAPESIGVGFEARVAYKMKPVMETFIYDVLDQSPDSLKKMRDEKARVAAEKKALEKELIGLLKGGPNGVKQWNRRGKEIRTHHEFFQPIKAARCDLSGFKAHGAVFVDGDWSNCNFSGANLSKAEFAENTFDGADLRKANARGTYFNTSSMTGADLRDANLTGATIKAVNFERAKLKGVVWKNAIFNRATVWPKGFKIPADLTFHGKGRDPREPEGPAVDPLCGTGLIKVTQHAKSIGIAHADPTPGDRKPFESFLTRSKARTDAKWVREFAKHSLLKNASGEIDPVVRFHNLAEIKKCHQWIDESKALIRSGILLVGSADSMLLTFDLQTGELLLFDDYVSCKEELIDGQTFAGQDIFDEDTGKNFKLQSPDGQRVFREALRDSAFQSWTSIGLYSQHVVNENSKK